MTRVIAIAAAGLLAACGADSGPDMNLDGTGDGDAADTGGDATDPGSDPDAPADTGPDTTPPPACPEKSYIWIANSAEGTLSKLCTINGEEMGRYVTSPQGASGDPSRTSVNLHGDMVVTNRDPSPGPSSVTKFAAEKVDCIDRNSDTVIQTSTGTGDVLAWGEDECMVWNTALPPGGGATAMGCRATAWQGDEDPDTGEGGHVWIGCMMNHTVYKIDGDTGEVLDDALIGVGPYGGAMDGNGNFWTVAMFCTVGLCNLSKLDMETMTDTTYPVPCGYGISADHLGRIWTAGFGCVNRLDPVTGTSVTLTTPGRFNRGIAVDNEGSVWAAVTTGDVLRVREDDVTEMYTVSGAGPAEIVGVAIDFQGYVWAISQGGNAALRIDPDTYDVDSFPIGRGPYTYSDMTGYQLSIVEIPY